LPRDLIQELIVHSYNLVVDKLNKKDKAALAAIS
jgi:predicted DNA-binding protein (MmcQ/YjbR family)